MNFTNWKRSEAMDNEKKSKVGPREQQLREMREARVEQNKKLMEKTFSKSPKPKVGKSKVVVQFKTKRGRTGR
jgi:hypothetical protein